MRRAWALLLLLLLSGCADEELQHYSIVTGLAVDMRDGQYRVTVESTGDRLNDDGSPELHVSTGEGRTLADCLSAIQRASGRRPYLRHTALLVLSRAAADALDELGEVLTAEHDLRLNARAALCEGDPAALFCEREQRSKTLLRRASQGMAGLTTCDVTLGMLLYDLYAEGVDGVLPLVEPERSQGLALLRGGRVAGTLDGRLTAAFLLASGRAEGGEITVDAPDGPRTFRLLDASGRTTAEMRENSAVLRVRVEADFRADRAYDSAEACEALLRDKLRHDVIDMLAALRGCGSDALGAGQYLARHEPNEWAALRARWDALYRESAAEIEVDVRVTGAGRARGGAS